MIQFIRKLARRQAGAADREAGLTDGAFCLVRTGVWGRVRLQLASAEML